MTDNALRVSVLLALQRALLGAIGPGVRKVLCRWNAHGIAIRAVFDGPILAEEEEAMRIAETEVMADFPLHAVSLVCERRDAPCNIVAGPGEHAVYHRLE